MNTYIKVALVGAGLVGAFYLLKKNGIINFGSSNFDGDSSNAAGSGCPTPCNIGDKQTSDCRCISAQHLATPTSRKVVVNKGSMSLPKVSFATKKY